MAAGSVARHPSGATRAAAAPLRARRSPSPYRRPRCLQLTLALTPYSINRGKVGICRSQRLPGAPRGQGGRGGRARVCAPAQLAATGPPAAATALWLSQESGRGLSSCLAAEKSPKPPAGSERGSGRPGLRGRRGRTADSPPSRPPVLLLAVLTPQIKGLRTMTSTLLSRRFSFLL